MRRVNADSPCAPTAPCRGHDRHRRCNHHCRRHRRHHHHQPPPPPPRRCSLVDSPSLSLSRRIPGGQAVDFHTLGHDFFPAGSAQRLWLDAYAKGVDRFVARAKATGLKAYFFVDLVVLPTPVLAAWPNATGGVGGDRVQWNAATRQLLQVLVDETFARFPGCDGWIVRTGETYTYDTPFHVGNSPSDGSQQRWVRVFVRASTRSCGRASV